MRIPYQPFKLIDLILKDILTCMAKGEEIIIASQGEEISTQNAADLLNVSRPFIVALIEHGKLRASKAGTRRRLLLSDVLQFRDDSMKKQSAAMDELVANGQEKKLGYE
jgi:excisionase family DNA binding protein